MGGSLHFIRFAIAVLLCAGLIYGDLYLSAFDNLRSGMSRILVPFRFAAALPGRAYTAGYDYLRSREGLLLEKAALEQQILEGTVKLKSLDFYVQQNNELRQLLNLRQRLPGRWLAAEFSRHATQTTARRITLSRGIADGVLPGMAVVDETGIIGQVIRADVNTCVVGLISDPGQWIAARAARNNLLVILRGEGDGRLAIEYVPNDADLMEGDELVAAGGLYPSGYPLAVVDNLSPGAVYKEGYAALLSDFTDSAYVLLYFADESTDAPAAGEPLPPALPAAPASP